MLFNSLDFAVFLPIVFLLYWFVFRSRESQNIFLLLASYIFYSWWDWRFLALILISTLVDYLVAHKLKKEKGKTKRKFLLWVSLTVNLGMLGVFKYYNFFMESFLEVFTFLGHDFQYNTIDIVLPVGISFYTFQTLSYTIDVYRKQLEPTDDIIGFATYVAFFPQLVAGPIERAKHLLPQFYRDRVFLPNRATDGLRQILWGLFKKMVIADNCAKFVDYIFTNYQELNGSTLVLGAVLFSFQIYCDFSGYSDIAIGTARLFGFDLRINFRFPYFSRNIGEFWRRWHISLSTWFRDYLYIPMGGSRFTRSRTVFNILVVFMVSALWHGANWTFIAWGIVHVLMFLVLVFTKSNRKYLDEVASDKKLPSFRTIVQIFTTFLLVTLSWVFFRSENVVAAMEYLSIIFSSSLLGSLQVFWQFDFLTLTIFIITLIFLEWHARDKNHALQDIDIKWRWPYRWLFYYGLVFVIFYFYGAQQEFIYFQF